MSFGINGIESMLKGAIAETLVYQLFSASGIPVFRMGHEYRMNDCLKWSDKKPVKNEAWDRLRLTPDLIILNKKGEPEYLEVKYHQQGRFHPNDLQDLELLKRWWGGPKIISVSYNKAYKIAHFRVIPGPYRLTRDRNPTEAYPVEDDPGWRIDMGVLKECEQHLQVFKYFLDKKQSRESE